VKGSGLNQGDTVLFQPGKDGSLKLIPMNAVERRDEKGTEKCTINSELCDREGMLERIVVGNYVLGRDAIVITSPKRISSAHIAEIRSATRMLMGLGIIEETPNRIILQCSVDAAKFPLNTVMRRLSTIASTMHKEAMEALVNFDTGLAEEVTKREGEADMIYWLVIRLLLSAQKDSDVAAKIGVEEPLEIVGNRLVAQYLETIADYAENIAFNIIAIERYILEAHRNPVKKSVVDSLSRISTLASSAYEEAVECLFSKNIKSANMAIEARESAEAEGQKLIDELPKQISDAHASAYLRDILWDLRRIAENGAAIAAVAINRSLENTSKLCSFTE
jgi:phosphate uptake regulator